MKRKLAPHNIVRIPKSIAQGRCGLVTSPA
jgi:hypothetical protein